MSGSSTNRLRPSPIETTNAISIIDALVEHTNNSSTEQQQQMNNNNKHKPSRHHHHSQGHHRNDAERMRKKFRDAIYVGNYERVARIIKNIIENDTLDLSSVLLPYASRHVTPIGLAARRGHVKICKVLVDVIKEYVAKQHYEQDASEFVSGPMLEMLLPNTHNCKLKTDSCMEQKEKEKSSDDEEVEDNQLNGGDESSSEQHNSLNPITNASISPQPLPMNAVHHLNVEYDTTNTHKPSKQSKKNKSMTDVHIGCIESTQQKLARLQSENEHKINELNMNNMNILDGNVDIENCSSLILENNPLTASYHRKSRSLPYIHLHSMLNRLDGENRTALSHACEKGQREVIEFLLSEPGIAIEAGGKHHEESWTNLHWACRYGHDQIVQLLLDHDANINAQTSKKKSTGLHLACATGHTEVIHVLLTNGAAKEIEDVYGCSPLSLAIHFGEKKVQQILYEAGIDVSPHDARRLKKDNHIFRRFGWIKIPPSISGKPGGAVLPDDVWCVVCGFLPCDELLLNVRLVSFGFLYVVHHPALRKLVNFKRSLPPSDKTHELVQYNENHQTLVLKAPSPENNFNAPAMPFAFVAPPIGGVFAPPPPPAAIMGVGNGVIGPPAPLVGGNGHHLNNGMNPMMTNHHNAATAALQTHAALMNDVHNALNNPFSTTTNAHAHTTNNALFPHHIIVPTQQTNSRNELNADTLQYFDQLNEFRSHQTSSLHVNHGSINNENEMDNDEDDDEEEDDEFTPPPIPMSNDKQQKHRQNNLNEDEKKSDDDEQSKFDEMHGQIASLIMDQQQIQPHRSSMPEPIPLTHQQQLLQQQRQENNNSPSILTPHELQQRLSMIRSGQTTHISNDNLNNNNNDESPPTLMMDLGQDPAFLSRTYSHNNFTQQSHILSISPSPPISPAFNANNANDASLPTLPLPQFLQFRQLQNVSPQPHESPQTAVDFEEEYKYSDEQQQNNGNNNVLRPFLEHSMMRMNENPMLQTHHSSQQPVISLHIDENKQREEINQNDNDNDNNIQIMTNQQTMIEVDEKEQQQQPQMMDVDDNNNNNHNDEQNGNNEVVEQQEQEQEEETWQFKHCRWLACAVNFGPSNLRKIRLTGIHILTQPLIRVLSCLSFIVHLELAHFHAFKLTTMDLNGLERVSQLKMIRQLKVFPVIRNNNYRAAMYDAVAVATFITKIGSTALTLGIKYENIDIAKEEEMRINVAMRKKISPNLCKEIEKESSQKDMAQNNEENEELDMAKLSSLTWKSMFDHLPSNLRSLRLHFGKDDSLRSGAVHGLKNFESIKCFTLHGDPGLYGQIKEWSDVFQRWNKLRYIVLGHRNNTKELQVPKEILEALPPMLPELALNISVHSIPNVVWYLKHVVKAECFLRINLHVVHKHKSDLYHASIHNEIIPCLTRFHNLETAYLKCGMVTLKQIEMLLQNCTKVSFVGFGIDASDEKQVVAFRILLEDYGFDKIVIKNKLNWLIAVKSYDKLLLDPTRCIHPVLEAFDDKSCYQPLKLKSKKEKTPLIMPHNEHIQPL